MEIKEGYSTLDNNLAKEIEVSDKKSSTNEKENNIQIPILIYDALGTIVAVCDPLKPLKTKEELAIYTLSSLKTYNQTNKEILKSIIHELGMDELANTIYNKLTSKNLTPMEIFYALVDIISEEFCKKIGDKNQELRIDVLLKTHKLAEPRIFEYINEYSNKIFNSNISQLILTQDNPIMKEVYNKMLKNYDINILTIPNPLFENLRKNNPKLYTLISNYLNSQTDNIGLYDDKKKNLEAAKQVGILTKLATGIKNDNPTIIKTEASNLVEELFNQRTYRIKK